MRVGALAALACLAALPVAQAAAGEPGSCLASAARRQVGVTLRYDASYARLAYPNGDVPPDRGACTDVLVRAYRVLGVDLQRLLHEDLVAAPGAYPRLWGEGRPDPSIDHRRVPNLAAFLSRHGAVLPVSSDGRAYRAGDVVTWRLPTGRPHIGIVSDRSSADGVPLVVHNVGRGALEEDVLFSYPITGHLRYLPAPLAESCRGGDDGA